MNHLDFDHDWIETNILAGESRTTDFLSMNPAGQVPVLQLEDGRVISQSNAIILYLAEGSELIPDDWYDRARMMEWLFWEQYSHEPYVAVARFQARYKQVPFSDIDPTLYAKANDALDHLEAALKESEERLKLIIENLAEGLVVVDPSGNSLYWNRTALELHHYSEMDERMGNLAEISKDYILLTPEGKRIPNEEWPIARLLRGEVLRDLDITLCNVRDKWTRILSYGGVFVRSKEGKPLMGLLTTRDITERKHAEIACADAEKRLRLAVDIAHLGSWEWSVADNAVYFSPQWKKLLGFQDDEIPNKVEEWSSRLHPAERELILSRIRSYVEDPVQTLQLEYRMRHRDGSYRWMIAQAIAACRARGRKIGICGQAPSDYPEFAQFLVEEGIDSISLNPDTVLRTRLAILQEEEAMRGGRSASP